MYPVVFRGQMKPRASMKPGVINSILSSQLQEPNHLRKWSSYKKKHAIFITHYYRLLQYIRIMMTI